jgi:hypothetical protein
MNDNFKTPRRVRSDSDQTATETESLASPQLKQVGCIRLIVPHGYHKLGKIVAKNATLETFIRFVQENAVSKQIDSMKRKFFLLSTGEVVMIQYSASAVHNKTVDLIKGYVGGFNIQHTGDIIYPLTAAGDYGMGYDSEGSAAQPDLIIARTGTNRPPSVIIEVLYSNGGVESARDYAASYFSSTSNVQMFIALKIMYPGDVAAPGQFKACAFVFRRENGTIPVDIISFGTVPINPRSRDHIQTVMESNLLRGEYPHPRCSPEVDYVVTIPWEVFVVGNEELGVVPWLQQEISHDLHLSMFRFQRMIELSFPEVNIPLPYAHECPDHLWGIA